MKTFIFFFVIFKSKYTHCNGIKCFEYSCEECETEEYGKCTKCRDTFTLIDGTCPCQDPSCALCLTDFISYEECYLCKKGYYRNGHECYCNIEYCEHCGENKCIKCMDSYYYNESEGKCIKMNDIDFNCHDQNCKYCHTEEEGTCYQCKRGYNLENGSCNENTIKVGKNELCPQGYFEDESYCKLRCDGLNCNEKNKEIIGYYSCFNNECILCKRNNLYYLLNCDNIDLCNIDGCMVCLNENKCFWCSIGYYYVEKTGKCSKCTEGCSICRSGNKCDYCLSGYELDNNNKCILTNNFDFNTTIYDLKRQELIDNNFIEKYYTYSTAPNTQLIKDVKKCSKINDINNECIECYYPYILKDNQCTLTCPDSNCLKCEYI